MKQQDIQEQLVALRTHLEHVAAHIAIIEAIAAKPLARKSHALSPAQRRKLSRAMKGNRNAAKFDELVKSVAKGHKVK